MSIEALGWAFARDELNTAQRFVLVVLANCHNGEDDRCFPSQEYIARKTGMTRTHINRIIGELASRGYITIIPRTRPNGSATSNGYQLHLSEVPQQREKPDYTGVRDAHTGGVVSTTRTPPVYYAHTHNLNSNLFSDSKKSQSAEDLFNEAEAEPENEPPKAKLFRKGKTILVSLGLSEARSGSVIGGWLKQKYDPTGILAAIEYAHRQCAVSPIAYVTQILKGQTDGKAKFGRESLDDRINELVRQARELEDQAGIIRPSDNL